MYITETASDVTIDSIDTTNRSTDLSVGSGLGGSLGGGSDGGNSGITSKLRFPTDYINVLTQYFAQVNSIEQPSNHPIYTYIVPYYYKNLLISNAQSRLIMDVQVERYTNVDGTLYAQGVRNKYILLVELVGFTPEELDNFYDAYVELSNDYWYADFSLFGDIDPYILRISIGGKLRSFLKLPMDSIPAGMPNTPVKYNLVIPNATSPTMGTDINLTHNIKFEALEVPTAEVSPFTSHISSYTAIDGSYLVDLSVTNPLENSAYHNYRVWSNSAPLSSTPDAGYLIAAFDSYSPELSIQKQVHSPGTYYFAISAVEDSVSNSPIGPVYYITIDVDIPYLPMEDITFTVENN